MARPEVLAKLKELGWDGPTSYTLPTLFEFIEKLEGGMLVEELKATRRKTSVKTEKQPKGEWITVPLEDVPNEILQALAEDGEVDEQELGRWRCTSSDGNGAPPLSYEKFVPEVKQPKVKPEKGAWESCEQPAGIPEGSDVLLGGGEIEIEKIKYRATLHIEGDAESGPTGMHLTWERFIPTPRKGKLKGDQQAAFDPRQMLRAFENEDMRVRTGGRDWTMIDVDWLAEQLKEAQSRGDAAVLVDVGGSQESCDVVWLEALVSVKRRLALREENGDAPADAGGA